MNIQVEQRPATSRGRLYPEYDDSAKILSVTSKEALSWPYGIHIDGRVLLDANEERMLANIDLLIPKKYWHSGIQPELPMRLLETDLLLTQPTLRQKDFSFDLSIVSDETESWVHIFFGEGLQGTTWVKLSPQCFVQLANRSLLGFYIML